MISKISGKMTKLLYLIALLLFFISGCSSKVATLPPSASSPAGTETPASQLTAEELADHAKRRIAVYENKLLEFTKQARAIGSDGNNPQLQVLSECRLRAYKMLNDYQKLYNKVLISQTTGDKKLDRETVARVLGDDNDFIDGACGQVVVGYYGEGGVNQAEKSAYQEQTEATTITEAYQSGRYEKAVSDYESMAFINGQTPSPQETVLYGKSLLKIGRVPEALAVFERNINKPNTVSLPETLQMAADIAFGLQKYDKAVRYYELLVGEMASKGQDSRWARQQKNILQNINNIPPNVINEYSHLLLNYLTYRPERDGFKVAMQARDLAEKLSYSPIFANIQQIEKRAQTMAERWFNQLVSQASDLAETDKQQAMQLLERVPLANLPVEKQKQIEELQNRLTETKEQKEVPVATTGGGAPETVWQEAMINLDNGNYDMAMEQLESLSSTPLAEKAKVQVKEVINLAAATERKKAARLFVQATKTEDMAQKKELLLASRDLLHDITVKYPEAEINTNGRLKKNLQMVESKLYEIDPNLLSAPRKIGDSLPYDKIISN